MQKSKKLTYKKMRLRKYRMSIEVKQFKANLWPISLTTFEQDTKFGSGDKVSSSTISFA